MKTKAKFYDASFLGRLVLLHTEYQSWENDYLNFEESDLFFAFDRDVLGARLTPWEFGPVDAQGGHGLGQLIIEPLPVGEKDPDAEDAALRAQLAWHTAFRLAHSWLNAAEKSGQPNEKKDEQPPKKPLFALGGQYDELDRACKYINQRIMEIRSGPHSGEGHRDTAMNAVFIDKLDLLSDRRKLSDQETKNVQDLIKSHIEFGIKNDIKGGLSAQWAKYNLDDLEKTFQVTRLTDVGLLDPTLHDVDSDGLKPHVSRILSQYFRDRIRGKSSAEAHYGSALENDVSALVELAWLNYELSNRERKQKLVLVTGHEAIIRAVYKTNYQSISRYIDFEITDLRREGEISREEGIELKNKLIDLFNRPDPKYVANPSQIEDEASKESWFENFAFKYVRHFSAIAAPALIDKTTRPFSNSSGASDTYAERDGERTEDVEKNADILAGLFAWHALRRDTSRTRLENIYLKPAGDVKLINTEAQNTVRKNWQELCINRLRDAQLEQFGFDEQIIQEARSKLRDVRGGLERWKLGLQNIMNLLQRMSEDKRDETMISSSEKGAIQLFEFRQKRSSNGIRKQASDGTKDNLPRALDIFLINQSCANQIMERLASKGVFAIDPEKFGYSFMAIAQNCEHPIPKPEDMDPATEQRHKHYVQFLVLAAVFASQERWKVAQIHAQRALNIVDREKEWRPTQVQIQLHNSALLIGREAHYVLAVCARILANNEIDLNRAEHHLKEYDSALKSDLDFCDTKSEILFPQRDKERLTIKGANEKFCILLAKYYFARFRNSEKSKGNKSQEKTLSNNCEVALKNLLVSLSMIHEHLKAFFENRTAYETEAYFTSVGICSNIFQVYAIYYYWNKVAEDQKGKDLVAASADSIEALAHMAGKWVSKSEGQNKFVIVSLLEAYYRTFETLQKNGGDRKFKDYGQVEVYFSKLFPAKAQHEYSKYENWRISKLRELAMINYPYEEAV